jgi:hypothetical protein
MENKILFRASAIGKLMVDPRNKSETLSETTKTYLSEVFINYSYGRKKDIQNRYTTKGLMVEEDSLTLYSRFKKEIFMKNEERFFNDFICGTPDLVEKNEVIDIKSSYDIFTFFKSKEDINKSYYWQLQAYMCLTGKKTSTLAYCLINTPDCLIQDEKRRLGFKMNIIDDVNKDYVEACIEIDRLMIYDDLPLEEKVHEVTIERNDKDIERMYERVEQCRKYMNETFYKLQTV